jgi:hypothetical protein
LSYESATIVDGLTLFPKSDVAVIVEELSLSLALERVSLYVSPGEGIELIEGWLE